MRRLLLICLLALCSPVFANLLGNNPSSLLGERPSATLGQPGPLNNSSDFLPVRQAFRLNVLEKNPEALTLRFIAAEGYYLYQHRFAFTIKPSELAAGAAQMPAGEHKFDEYFGDVQVYRGIVDIRLPLNNPQDQPLSVEVSYQGCADKGLCYPPENETLNLGLEDNADSAQHQPWNWRSLALFFLAGLGLTFTPCVLPMLPILSGVVLRGQTGGMRSFSLALAYVLPMALCFALLGALMGVFGAGLNLQARLQSPWILVPFALFFAAFALAMFGLFELRMPRFVSEPLDRLADKTQGGSLWGAAVLGVLSSLLVSPCVSAPLAGALLYISTSGDAFGGGLQLFALGLGMGTPLVIFATGGGALLPKAGTWMISVRNAFGVLLLGVAVWMLERVLPGSWGLALWGLLALGVGIYLLRVGLRQTGHMRLLSYVAAILCLAYAAASVIGVSQNGSDPSRPWQGQHPSERWQTLSDPAQLQQALAQAKANQQAVAVDWYADWCISCKVIEREVLNQPQVDTALGDYQLIRFDITQSTAEQRALLDQYQLFGPPAILFFAANGQEQAAKRVVGEITVDELLHKISQSSD